MKKNAITTAFLFFSIILLTGCGLPTRWQHTVKIDDLGDVPNGKSRIIFFNPTGTRGLILDATNDNLILFGSPGGGEGITQDIEPGEYLFMVSGENADFMRATLEPNRTYYSLIQWRFGVAMTRYGLWPIRNGGQGDYPFESEQVQEWLKNIVYVKPHEKHLRFFGSERYMRGYQKQRDKYWPKWQEKLSEEKLRRTLLPEDGIPIEHFSKQNTHITQGVKTESYMIKPSFDDQEELQTLAVENPEPKKSAPHIYTNTSEHNTQVNHGVETESNMAQPSIDNQEELQTLAVENGEPKRSVLSTYTSKFRALMTLRDDGIISEDEFQKQRSEILASKQRSQTPTQPKTRIREVDPHEIRYIVGDPTGQNHNSSTSDGVRKQQNQGVVSQSADIGTSKQTDVNQNNSNDAKKTEWVRKVGGKKFYCVRSADQTICQ